MPLYKIIAVAAGILAWTQSVQAENLLPAQAWLTSGISQRLDYGLEIQFENEQRFSFEGREWQHYEITPQLLWHYSPRYNFSLGYEESGQWAPSGKLENGHQGLASATFLLPLREWKLSSRQRLQAGSGAKETTVAFRQLTRVEYDDSRLPLHLKPFLDDEWFLDLVHGELSENRLRGGLAYSFNRVSTVEIYGMRLDEWPPSGGHDLIPVIGLNLNLSF